MLSTLLMMYTGMGVLTVWAIFPRLRYALPGWAICWKLQSWCSSWYAANGRLAKKNRKFWPANLLTGIFGLKIWGFCCSLTLSALRVDHLAGCCGAELPGSWFRMRCAAACLPYWPTLLSSGFSDLNTFLASCLVGVLIWQVLFCVAGSSCVSGFFWTVHRPRHNPLYPSARNAATSTHCKVLQSTMPNQQQHFGHTNQTGKFPIPKKLPPITIPVTHFLDFLCLLDLASFQDRRFEPMEETGVPRSLTAVAGTVLGMVNRSLGQYDEWHLAGLRFMPSLRYACEKLACFSWPYPGAAPGESSVGPVTLPDNEPEKSTVSARVVLGNPMHDSAQVEGVHEIRSLSAEIFVNGVDLDLTPNSITKLSCKYPQDALDQVCDFGEYYRNACVDIMVVRLCWAGSDLCVVLSVLPVLNGTFGLNSRFGCRGGRTLQAFIVPGMARSGQGYAIAQYGTIGLEFAFRKELWADLPLSRYGFVCRFGFSSRSCLPGCSRLVALSAFHSAIFGLLCWRHFAGVVEWFPMLDGSLSFEWVGYRRITNTAGFVFLL
ncbi:hypothetical protein Nepgr_003905 [Nepenthes gracilis]|uniref:Uncharacterized protein n=1 Tax=Nepenthes gracilis TaxID=150966 RepID=A0AAD3S0D2_NEPGR|nr:hypothetical protein Nepgr_003905 [Nepenthes gracilis]